MFALIIPRLRSYSETPPNWFTHFFFKHYRFLEGFRYKIKIVSDIIMNVITKTTIKRSNTLFLNEGMYLGIWDIQKFVSSKPECTSPSATLMIKISLPIPN